MMKKKMNKEEIAKWITHSEYIKMLNTVHDCPKWSYKIQGIIGGCFAYHDKAEIPKHFLQEMREAARTEGKQKHVDVLNEVFGEEAPQPKFKVGDWVRTTEYARVCRVESIISGRSFRLKPLYNNKYCGTFFITEEYAEPWIPKVGEWVVYDGKTYRVCRVFNRPGWYSVDAENLDTKDLIVNYPVKNLRPATKEEIAEAKGEGEMLFTEDGEDRLADLIASDFGLGHRSWLKIPGDSIKLKAEWINKVLTKALKDEGK